MPIHRRVPIDLEPLLGAMMTVGTYAPVRWSAPSMYGVVDRDAVFVNNAADAVAAVERCRGGGVGSMVGLDAPMLTASALTPASMALVEKAAGERCRCPASEPSGSLAGGSNATLFLMSIRAKVSRGRIIVDEPTLLPEGTTLNLIVDDEGDDLDAEESAALDAHLSNAWNSVRAGNVRPADELLAELRARR